MDAESERLINEAVGNLGRDRTVIVVSHTPEMINEGELVLTVRNGSVSRPGDSGLEDTPGAPENSRLMDQP